MRKKIFIVAGEASGDALAAWYVDRFYKNRNNVHLEAVGGEALEQLGVQLYKRFDELNVTGVVEIIKHIPRLLGIMKELVNYLIQQKFDELIVVDFPGFNLALIKRLKKIYPAIRVVYVSPPQLWCWGAWRIKKLKKYVDHVLVLYQFEKKWYADRGLSVEWIATPVYERLSPYMNSHNKKNMIAIIPGSRLAEVERFMPMFAFVMLSLAQQYPQLSFVIPCASSFSSEWIVGVARSAGLDSIIERIRFVENDHEKYNLLSQCCCALTKPGTVTLELALLGVPAIVAFKTSLLTYLLARPLVRVQFMALPNIFLGEPVYPEFIQWECDNIRLAQAMEKLYASFRVNALSYQKVSMRLQEVARLCE